MWYNVQRPGGTPGQSTPGECKLEATLQVELKLVEFELALKKWGVKVPVVSSPRACDLNCRCNVQTRLRSVDGAPDTGCHLSEVDNVVHFFAHIDEDYSGSISVEAGGPGGEPTTLSGRQSRRESGAPECAGLALGRD